MTADRSGLQLLAVLLLILTAVYIVALWAA